jgi:hypothetical protein
LLRIFHDQPNHEIESSQRAAEGRTVSDHGQRESALLIDAVHWRDRVINDVRSEQGRLSAREHQVSVKLIGEVATVIAGYIARGRVLDSPAETIRQALDRNDLPISDRQARRVTKFLEARGHAARLHTGSVENGPQAISALEDFPSDQD